MSDPGTSFSAGLDREAGNPVLNLLASMCNAWMSALTALQVMAGQAGGAPGSGRSGPAMGDPVAALLSAMTRVSAAISDVMAQTTAASPSRASGSPAEQALAQGADLAPLMAQVAVVAAGSTLNYWRGLAEVYGRHQATMLDWWARRAMSQTPVTEAERRLMAEELRAFLREAGEVALREARILETKLDQIGEAVASATDQPDPSSPNQRHWTVKEKGANPTCTIPR